METKDIIIVGGGIAGIMCAYRLSETGRKVTVIEAEKILNGVTINTTAHINALQAKYADIPAKKQREVYYQSQIDALNGIESIIKKHKINCSFRRVDSYVFGGRKSRKLILEEYDILKSIGAPVEFFESREFPFGTMDAIKLPNQAEFNPVEFLNGLPKNFEIIENTRIKKVSLRKKILYAEGRAFKANKIIFATNYPIVNIRGLYAFKMYKSISYAVHIKTGKKLGAIFNSIEGDGLTYRETPDGIIIGGLDHRDGRFKKSGKYERLFEIAEVFGPAGAVARQWAANDCMTFDSVPYVGKFKRLGSENIYLISGFSKWGMTNSYVAANIIHDLILGKKNKYAETFKPTRCLNIKVWHKVLFNALYNVFNILKSYIGPVFKTHKDLKNGEGGIVSYGFRKRAVYKDENGKLYILSPKCPHMRCQLAFNPETTTWDCPCHGSRLTVDGQIITAPTVKSNKITGHTA